MCVGGGGEVWGERALLMISVIFFVFSTNGSIQAPKVAALYAETSFSNNNNHVMIVT